MAWQKRGTWTIPSGYIAHSNVKKRLGWNEEKITKWLSAKCIEKKTPYKTIMRLYPICLVEQVEKSENFILTLPKSKIEEDPVVKINSIEKNPNLTNTITQF